MSENTHQPYETHQTYEHQTVVSEGDEYYHHQSADEVGLRDDEGILDEYSEKAAPPPKRNFYKTKKYWIICAINTVIVTIVAVVLALYVIFPKVAQNIMNSSKIDVTSSDISFVKPTSLDGSVYSKRDGDDLNSTFYMNLGSALSHTGPFSATIKFNNPINVYYNDTYLGDVYFFNETKVSGGKGTLNAVTPFMIKDQDAFASFAKTMLAVESFVWTLKGTLDISALTRTAKVNLNKDVTLNGFNGFPNVQITSFQLPGDDPNGGIQVALGTDLTSPSPIGVQLGTIKMAIGYQGVNLGTVAGSGVSLVKGENNIILTGTLVPQNDAASLEKVSELFSNYLSGKLSNTTATGLSCAPDGVNPITWLSTAFETVVLNVGLTAGAPLKIINGISLGYLDLAFNSASPYSPSLSGSSVVADFQMPFGFSINITQVSQNVSLGINNTDNTLTQYFATMATPYAPATSNQQNGTISFALSSTNIVGITGQESVFNSYTYGLTANQNYTFMIAGTANTIASTPIGNVTLSGVNFTVPSTLGGLQFLNSTATTISSLDVTGGTAEGLSLAIGVSLDNPSDFSISTGDVSFDMGASGTTLGVVTLTNLTLARGSNSVNATSVFDPASSDVGLNLLSTFIMGQDNAVDISGTANSTAITSLAEALGNITLSSTLPGLTTALVQGASISIATDSISTGIVPVKVSIHDPFTAGLSITSIVAANTFQGMPIGNIDQDISSNPFAISGKSTGTSQDLDMTMNMDPANIALLLRNLAVAGGMDTSAIDALLTLGGFSVDGQEQITGDASTFSGFNIATYVEQAMSYLSVDLSVTSGVTIGQYSVDLTFSQAGVAVSADDTILQLIPVVGQPIVQSIVDGSVLAFDTILLSNIGESSFTVQMSGSISNTGPMDATISFPEPLTVSWEGQVIGTVTMADINAVADQGATFSVQGTFTVGSADVMGSFAAYLINNESFQWDITSSAVSVTALGYTFTSISLNKYVTLSGANGFANDVTVNSFNLPSNDAAGGITLTVDVSIYNPSQVGFDLGGASFENYFGSVDLGPLATNGAANFAPRTSSQMSMTGRLIAQSSTEGIEAIQTVFGNYLSGKNSNLTIYGVSGSGSSGEVSWLTAAFKTIKIENVVLPGPATIPTLIPDIEMKNLQLDFTQDEWAPPTSSSDVEATLQNPFGFPIDVTSLDMTVAATFNGSTVATLDIPTESASTSNNIITTGFDNIPFKVQDQTLFTEFDYGLTLSSSVTFGLKGTSNAVASTAVGTLTLPGITFDVDTTLAGFNSFGNALTINSLSVTGATLSYIIVTLDITLTNPSNITITVGDINFDVELPSANNAVIGKAYLSNATIAPGAQAYSSQMHLGEGIDLTNTASLAALGNILTAYLTGASVPLLVAGSETSTTIAPLQPGIAALQMTTTMNGNNVGLIESLSIVTGVSEMISQLAHVNITLHNPLDTPFTIYSIYAETYHHFYCYDPLYSVGLTGTEYLVGTLDQSIPEGLRIEAGASVTVGPWNVTLNVDPTDFYFVQKLADVSITDNIWFYNVTQNASVVVGDSFEVQNMYYYQNEVPYTAVVTDFVGIYTQYDLTSTFCNNMLYLLNDSSIEATSANVTNTTTTSNTTAAATTASLTTIDVTTTIDATTTVTTTIQDATTTGQSATTTTTTDATVTN